MKYFIEILILVIPPIVYALWNGRNGIKHPGYDQVKTVAFIMLICVTLARLHYIWYEGAPFVIVTTAGVLWWYLKAFLVAITGFGLIFPLAFNWMWWNRYDFKGVTHGYTKYQYILNHLSATAWPDKMFLKFKIGWKLRLSIYLTLFILSIVWFVW